MNPDRGEAPPEVEGGMISTDDIKEARVGAAATPRRGEEGKRGEKMRAGPAVVNFQRSRDERQG